MSQIVHVVSMLDVMIKLGETTFQSRDVMGAVCSGDLELERSASGDSFCRGCSFEFTDLVTELVCCNCDSLGNDHNRRWSPEVARRSVDCLEEEGGSHKILVTGYECVASAVLTKSRPRSA